MPGLSLSLQYKIYFQSVLTFNKSSGCVQAAAIADAIPPRYHLCFLITTFIFPLSSFVELDVIITTFTKTNSSRPPWQQSSSPAPYLPSREIYTHGKSLGTGNKTHTNSRQNWKTYSQQIHRRTSLELIPKCHVSTCNLLHSIIREICWRRKI